MSNDSLKTLHTALIDAREGYAKALEKARTRCSAKISAPPTRCMPPPMATSTACCRRGETVDDDGSITWAPSTRPWSPPAADDQGWIMAR